jgi:hypothetical protein
MGFKAPASASKWQMGFKVPASASKWRMGFKAPASTSKWRMGFKAPASTSKWRMGFKAPASASKWRMGFNSAFNWVNHHLNFHRFGTVSLILNHIFCILNLILMMFLEVEFFLKHYFFITSQAIIADVAGVLFQFVTTFKIVSLF